MNRAAGIQADRGHRIEGVATYGSGRDRVSWGFLEASLTSQLRRLDEKTTFLDAEATLLRSANNDAAPPEGTAFARYLARLSKRRALNFRRRRAAPIRRQRSTMCRSDLSVDNEKSDCRQRKK